LVIEGQPLFELDGTTLRGKLEVAEQSLTVTEAEYRQTAQQAILDGRSKAQLAILAGRIEERRREADYLRSLLERILVKAPKPGITIFNDPMEWIGRPVTTGERVMIVAESTNTELEAWLALGDLVIQETGGPVTLFLNVDPLHPVRANVRYIAYEAMPRPDGAMAYRLRATISEGQDKPRVGLKGTARIDGPEVALGYWLLRRPLVVLRQWLGW
jgi:hypothetical protein